MPHCWKNGCKHGLPGHTLAAAQLVLALPVATTGDHRLGQGVTQRIIFVVEPNQGCLRGVPNISPALLTQTPGSNIVPDHFQR